MIETPPDFSGLQGARSGRSRAWRGECPLPAKSVACIGQESRKKCWDFSRIELPDFQGNRRWTRRSETATISSTTKTDLFNREKRERHEKSVFASFALFFWGCASAAPGKKRPPGIANLPIGAIAVSGFPWLRGILGIARFRPLGSASFGAGFQPLKGKGDIFPGATLRLSQAGINPRRWRSTAVFRLKS
jgi:hypothetical protein